MSIQLLSYDELRAFFIECQKTAQYLKDENDRKKYFELRRTFEKEMIYYSQPSSVLVAARDIQMLFAKYFADLGVLTEADKKRADRINKSFDTLQASLKDEMHLSPQQRANVKEQYQKASNTTLGINSQGTKVTFQKYLNYGVATDPKDIKTVIAMDPKIEFQNYMQRNTVIVNKALSGLPPRAKVYVVGLDHYGSWSPIRWLPPLIGGKSAVGSRWKDKESLALAVDLAHKGFHIQNKLPKSIEKHIRQVEKGYEEKVKKAEEDKLKIDAEPKVSLGRI